MKKNILKVMIVAGLIALSADLRAFTAVTSGLWSNAATWGGVGPGASVSNQDIIIPSGITVDLDMDVTFNGLSNSFWVTGMLMNTNNHMVNVVTGTVTGSGTVDIHKLVLGALSSFVSVTGPLTLDVLRNEGTAMNLMSAVVINDTLDLEQGAVVIGSGSSLQFMLNDVVRVNSGVLVNNGGVMITGAYYDVWYVGISKIASEELNSGYVRDVNILLNSNAETVTLNDNVIVNGVLNMVAGHVALNGNRLRLNGDLAANSGAMFESSGASDLVIDGTGNLTSPLHFDVGSTLDELVISRDTFDVHLESELGITGHLRMESGYFVVDNTANLVMNASSWISMVAGELEINGSLDGTQSYNVEYIGDSLLTGAELSGSGLNDLTIYTWNANMAITLTQNVTVPGNFILANGALVLDTFGITFLGDFTQTSNTQIRGTSLSDMNFSMSTSANDTLWMGTGSGLENLTLNIPPSSVLFVGRNLVIYNELTLLSGRLETNWDGVYILNGSITGASDTRYIITSGPNGLHRELQAGDPVYQEFPIGTMNHYAPLALKQNLGNPNGLVMARVMEGVWTDGDSGTDVSITQSVVNKTWEIMPDSGLTSLDITVRTGWLSTCEMNGFDRQNCYIKNYYNSAWDSYPVAAAGIGTFGTYTSERLNIPNGGFMAVADNASPLNVAEAPVTDENVYPNPTNDFITTNFENPGNDMLQYEIFDATGRLVYSMSSADQRNVIDFRGFDRGAYTMRVTNLSTNEMITKQIIKS